METENKGYSLVITNSDSNERVEKIFLKPMSLYVPDIAFQAVRELMEGMPKKSEHSFVLTVTNKNNGVSVDKYFTTHDKLDDPLLVADSVKDLINIVRGYESDEETNVCGW
ncbi:DUF1869 domain-containing protein [Enterobacteriaceae bacterium H11S18]|uniref:DUF1869 domain-containing protein n=1 Tax=Dryocola clanedunensis TaxID=2925396 RepID=UPI0022F03987|nr:DUF1869 domain-containing protein [Dryocola clanedunensis]MCT4709226.1 DUF1869 domain-containing protein [Dryocola clanedunensis]